MLTASTLRAQIESRIPSAFAKRIRLERRTILSGIFEADSVAGGIPVSSLTEICGVGKTSMLLSLLAHVSRENYCALVDASDNFDPTTAQAAGINFSRLLWVRCGKSQRKLRPLEQAFKAADMLLQSSGFGLIAVDLSGVPEKIVRRVPMSTWFRFSRVVENQPTALVFIEQQPHATSCAELVLKFTTQPATFSGKLLANFNLKVELLRVREKKGVQSVSPEFLVKAQWA